MMENFIGVVLLVYICTIHAHYQKTFCQYLAQSTNKWRNSHTKYFHIYMYICTHAQGHKLVFIAENGT